MTVCRGRDGKTYLDFRCAPSTLPQFRPKKRVNASTTPDDRYLTSNNSGTSLNDASAIVVTRYKCGAERLIKMGYLFPTPSPNNKVREILLDFNSAMYNSKQDSKRTD